MIDATPKTSEWKNFGNSLPHIKEWRTVGKNLEIREEIMCPNDQHGVIAQCEIWKQHKFFSLPEQFCYKNKITSHIVMAKKNDGDIPYYSIHINTVIELKYFKIHTID